MTSGRAAVVLFAPPALGSESTRAKRHFIRIGKQGMEDHFEDEKGHHQCNKHPECVTGEESGNNTAPGYKPRDYPPRPPAAAKSEDQVDDADEGPKDNVHPSRKTRAQCKDGGPTRLTTAKDKERRPPPPSLKGKEKVTYADVSSESGKYLGSSFQPELEHALSL